MPNRREFIQNGLGFVASGLTANLSTNSPSRHTIQTANNSSKSIDSTEKVLVVLELSGGNDGLNTVIPFTDDAYYRARPHLAIPANQVLPISNHAGLHSAMRELAALFNRGQVAVISGVGYPKSSRSHFQAMDIWQSADPTLKESSGWLGRYLETNIQFQDNPFAAIACGNTMPLALTSQNDVNSILNNGHDFHSLETHAHMETLKALYQGRKLTCNIEFVSHGEKIRTSAKGLQEALQHQETVISRDAMYPHSELAHNLQTIAKIIVNELGTRIFYVRFGGFDTHENQLASQARLLGAFSEAVAAFYRDLTARGYAHNVMLLTFSEFGRSLTENAKRGTDHGTANSLFVVGPAVRGGFYGAFPDLNDLTDGAVKFTTDFRAVYATILDQWLGVDSYSILGNPYPQLGFV